jgi:hypothetical protein
MQFGVLFFWPLCQVGYHGTPYTAVRILYLSINASGYSDHGHAHRVQTEDYIPTVALHASSLALIVSFLFGLLSLILLARARSYFLGQGQKKLYGYMWVALATLGSMYAVSMFIIGKKTTPVLTPRSL